MCQELNNLVMRLMTDPSVPADVRDHVLNAVLEQLRRGGVGQLQVPGTLLAPQPQVFTGAAAAAPASTRRLVYVHGICSHVSGYSDSMWHALMPFASNVFGASTLGQTRLEVLWSDIVNHASNALGAAAIGTGATAQPAALSSERNRQKAASEIRDALSDRADQHQMIASASAPATFGAAPMAALDGFSIPGLSCVDDFSIYLTSNSIRQQIIDRFTSIVGPQLNSGVQIDIISHSWGTVVAYEGLRQLAASGTTSGFVRNFFTVGAALSIGPVKSRLLETNQDGQKPSNVRQWINLNARGDLVGGTLKGRPFQVDTDYVNLDPVGCPGFSVFVSPICAHSSYFVDANVAVNRDLFARYITSL
jgi:hypothetical protein